MKHADYLKLMKRLDEIEAKNTAHFHILNRRINTATSNIHTIIAGMNQILPDQITIRKEMPDDLMNWREATDYLGITNTKIMSLSREGKIPFIQTTSGRKYSKSELDDWILARPKNNQRKAAPKALQVNNPNFDDPYREDKPNDLINAVDAGKILGVQERTVRQWAADGKIPYVMNGRAKYYSIKELTALINTKP